MKTLIFCSIIFSAFVLPSYAEISENSIETDIAVIKTEIQNLSGKIDDKFNGLEKRFDSIEKNFDRQNTLTIACIAIPMALITLMIAWRSIKDNSLQKQIDTLSQVIESQNQHLTEKIQS